MKKQSVAIVILAVFFFSSGTRAVPLKSATVTEIKNDVKIAKEAAVERTAMVKDAVAGKDRLWTGKKSRAELEFSDRSIVRLGANTQFSFDPTSRNMKVERGTALIHVPPALGGARISSPAVTAAITGDVVAMRVDGKGMTQIVALTKDEQGPVRVTFNKTGETRTLEPGQLLTVDPTAMKMPEPVTVAVDAFVQSSGLAGGFKKELPDSAQKEIKQTTELQAKEIQSGNLEGTTAMTGIKTNVNAVPTTVNNVTVQSTAGSSFAGRYIGKSSATGGGSSCNETNSLNWDIRDDGSFTVTSVDQTPGPDFGKIDISTGTINSDGTFTAIDDHGTVTGTIQAGATTISGTFSDNSCTGVFSASK